MIHSYVLVGAGGTGSILAEPLLRYLKAHHGNRDEAFRLAIFDGDEVEAKNLDRQSFGGESIGRNKAEALADELHDYTDQDTEIHGEASFITDEHIGLQIRNGDTVLIAADNYNVRARIEQHGLDLRDITVINGGNEKTDGSCQIWIKHDGKNITPPLSWQHDEIYKPSEHDPSKLDCLARANLPGSEQTIIANMMSATQMLNMVFRYHTIEATKLAWHETYFDLHTGNARAYDQRHIKGWQYHAPKPPTRKAKTASAPPPA